MGHGGQIPIVQKMVPMPCCFIDVSALGTSALRNGGQIPIIPIINWTNWGQIPIIFLLQSRSSSPPWFIGVRFQLFSGRSPLSQLHAGQDGCNWVQSQI
jgi:hypothetical protein